MMIGQTDLLNDGKTIESVDEKLYSFSSDELEEMYSSSALATCGDGCIDGAPVRRQRYSWVKLLT